MWVPPLPRRHDGLCRVSAAAKCYNEVGVHDMKGSIADAKSILGMMSLDYSHPVKIVCEDEHDLDCVIQALRQ